MTDGNTKASVKFDAVQKSFGSVKVLEEFNLEVEPGEFLVLLGASGSGKTTALRILSGLETPSAGRVHIGERDVTEVLPKYRDISMVFQSYALYPHKTVAENIGFPLKVKKLPKAEMDAAILDAAKQVQLEALLDRYPRELSGGQRQRVALARAIIRRPSVFLMDEPLSNLDAKLRGHMRAELKHMQGTLGITTIYVTHDQIEAMTLADRVVVMNQGIVQQVGSPTEIYDRPANAFVAGFIGSPAMNLVEGSIQGGTFTAENITVKGLAAADGPVTLGFRAEDASIAAKGEISAPVYAMELLGDATMVTARAGTGMVAVKAAKDYRAKIGEQVSISIPKAACHLFDSASGARIGEG